jgi:hypothetical protein
VTCIRTMNRVVGALKDPLRVSRYLEAAVDLEILMDHEGGDGAVRKDLSGIPSYLVDGYTDLGIEYSVDSLRRGERISVDKRRLRIELLRSKRQTLAGFSCRVSDAHRLEEALREIASSLRESVGYDENDFKRCRDDGTVFLLDSVAERSVNCRHLAILYQLWLQEAGISSRLAKGMLRLFGLKLRHVWNIVEEGNIMALVDVAFSEGDVPLVLSGSSAEEVYQRAAKLHRTYCPRPDSFHHYQIRKTSEAFGD